jgi:RNA binding exosome subunit
MLFDQRTRAALRDAGLTQEDLREVEQAATDQAREDAERVESFFDSLDTVYSDMDLTHSRDDLPEHDLDYVDLFTHSEDVRGFLRFDSWGAYVEGARVLEADDGRASVVELTLGPTVNDRVRFARDRAALE